MPDISAALLDVRKSYRLLWAFQRRALDLINEVSGHFSSHRFLRWENGCLDPVPNSRRNPADDNAWTFLPLLNASFLYEPIDSNPDFRKAGEWMLELALVPDTGLDEDAESEASVLSQPVDSSKSELEFYFWKCTKPMKISWSNVWHDHPWPTERNVAVQQSERFLVYGAAMPLEILSEDSHLMSSIESIKKEAYQALDIKPR
jgi:hypothetical protein